MGFKMVQYVLVVYISMFMPLSGSNIPKEMNVPADIHGPYEELEQCEDIGADYQAYLENAMRMMGSKRTVEFVCMPR